MSKENKITLKETISFIDDLDEFFDWKSKLLSFDPPADLTAFERDFEGAIRCHTKVQGAELWGLPVDYDRRVDQLIRETYQKMRDHFSNIPLDDNFLSDEQKNKIAFIKTTAAAVAERVPAIKAEYALSNETMEYNRELRFLERLENIGEYAADAIKGLKRKAWTEKAIADNNAVAERIAAIDMSAKIGACYRSIISDMEGAINE